MQTELFTLRKVWAPRLHLSFCPSERLNRPVYSFVRPAEDHLGYGLDPPYYYTYFCQRIQGQIHFQRCKEFQKSFIAVDGPTCTGLLNETSGTDMVVSLKDHISPDLRWSMPRELSCFNDVIIHMTASGVQ